MKPILDLPEKELLSVLKDFIALRSVNPPGNEIDMANYISRYLEAENIDVHMQPIQGHNGRTNVVGRLRGRGTAPPIIFTGHMDVVPVSASELKEWQTPPFEASIKDGKMYGRGTADMKSGLAAALVAMALLKRANIQPPGDVLLVATADEEATMQGAKALLGAGLIDDAKNIVVCEPTELELQHCCKGRTWATITVYGKTSHASIQNSGLNAIHMAHQLMDSILQYKLPENHHDLLGNTFWQITEINGGIEPAVVPDLCQFTVDARISPGQTSDDIWAYLDDCISSLRKKESQLKVDVNVIEKRDPWVTGKDHSLILNAQKAIKQVGTQLIQSGFMGTTDASVLRHIGASPIVLGPGSMLSAHKANEYVKIDEYFKAAKIYLAMMQSPTESN